MRSLLRTSRVSAFSATIAATIAVTASGVTATQQSPTFRSGSNLIAVDVSVLDKNGQPVTDLTAADFEIREDGAVQAVQALSLVTVAGTSTPAPSTLAPGTLAPGAITSTGTLAPGTFSRPRVLIFVFDQAHLSATGYNRSRTAVESFLKDGALPSDAIGVVSNGTMLNNRIDSDKSALLRAMASMTGPNLSRLGELRSFPRLIDEAEASSIARNDDTALAAAVTRACQEDPIECNRPGGRDNLEKQISLKALQLNAEALRDAQISLQTLQTLASGLGRLSGSKYVLVFSEGYFTGDLASRLKDVVTTAARSGVRFSTLDARGLNRDPRSQNFLGGQPLTGPGDLAAITDNDADVLTSLAIDTGGELIMNRNDLRPGIDLIARAAGTYYVVGYAPAKPMDGTYRKISVKVLRPELTVRARKGYVAVASPSPSALPEIEGALPIAPSPAPPAAHLRPSSSEHVASLVATSGVSSAAGKALADAGWNAYTKGDVTSARAQLAAAVATGGAPDWVFYALGQAEFALAHYGAAMGAWETVRSRQPEFEPVYFDLADAHLSLGRGTDALAILRVAAAKWPVDPEAQNALATQLVKRGALDEALDILQRITAAKPSDSLGFFNLARTYHLRYQKLQQNVAASGLRTPNAIGDADRQKAIQSYTRYLDLGGPFEKEAREALAALNWKPDTP